MKFNDMLCRLSIFFYLLCHTHAVPNTHIQSNPINPKYPIRTMVKEATTQASPKKKKALVAVFGVFSRSLRKTWPQINRMIVKPLEKDYDVEIYGFNNQVDNIDMLDGRPIQKSSASTIKTNHKLIYQEVKQSQLDEYIKQDNSWLTHSWFAYDPSTCKNAIRQFYVEQQVADYISNTKEDYAIVVSLIADIYPYVPISTREIDARDNIIFTSGLLDTGGITNGYYVGSKRSVYSIMATVNLIKSLDKRILDEVKMRKRGRKIYERILAINAKTNKLERRTTDMIFCKLRNHLTCAYINRITKSEAFISMSWSQKFWVILEQFPVLEPMRRIGVVAKVLIFVIILIIISRRVIKWCNALSGSSKSAS